MYNFPKNQFHCTHMLADYLHAASLLRSRRAQLRSALRDLLALPPSPDVNDQIALLRRRIAILQTESQDLRGIIAILRRYAEKEANS